MDLNVTSNIIKCIKSTFYKYYSLKYSNVIQKWQRRGLNITSLDISKSIKSIRKAKFRNEVKFILVKHALCGFLNINSLIKLGHKERHCKNCLEPMSELHIFFDCIFSEFAWKILEVLIEKYINVKTKKKPQPTNIPNYRQADQAWNS